MTLSLFFIPWWDLNTTVSSFLNVLRYCNSVKQGNLSKMRKAGMALLLHLQHHRKRESGYQQCSEEVTILIETAGYYYIN